MSTQIKAGRGAKMAHQGKIKLGRAKNVVPTIRRASIRIASNIAQQDTKNENGRQKHVVYLGGRMGAQSAPFQIAAAQFADKIDFKYITIEDVRKTNWTEEEFVSQFTREKGFDAHWILSHPEQATLIPMNWNASALKRTFVEQLYHLPGYPSEEGTGDATLHQDKAAYLKYLGPEMTIPTLVINFSTLTPDTLSMTQLYNIAIFGATHMDEGGGEFTVKLPYTTNSTSVVHCRDLQSAVAQLITFQQTHGASMDYALLQPTLRNREEVKIVFTECGFSHFAHNHFRPNPAHRFATDEELIAYGTAVYEKMQTSPNFLKGPVVRIDVMCRKDRTSNPWKGMVCNELESLEAMTCAKLKSGGNGKDFEFNLKLEKFWRLFIGLTYEHVSRMHTAFN
jgi:hypothetical protein